MGSNMVLTGNYAAAEAAALCRPDLVAAYPITPQSSVVEHLAEMVHEGRLDTELVQVESEHSAMSVVQGAAAGGGRVFTATSAQGLALMYEPFFRMSTLRLPMVMAIATREMTSPESIWSGQQDVMSVRDAGWIQVFCDGNQEIADMIIQGYRIAEHQDVRIPVCVCYDGFYSSHLTTGVYMPSQAEVDAFLRVRGQERKALLDPESPLALDPMTPGELLMHYRKNHLAAMQRALKVIEETELRFSAHFGRFYGGALSKYRMDDAEVALVTIGGMSGAAMDAVDEARERGIKVGLVRLRFIRPFPEAKLRSALSGIRAFYCVDRSVSFGWNCGPMFVETRAALSDALDKASFSAIGGLGGADISVADFTAVIDILEQIKNSPGLYETFWLMKD